MMIAVTALATTRQIPTISVKTQEVRVDVFVSDRGRPIPGLKSEDFEVYDNRLRQEIVFAAQEDIAFNAALALDLSPSVAGDRLINLKAAVGKFLDELKGNEHATLLTFNHTISLITSPADSVAKVNSDLDRVRPTGDTSLIDAAYAALVISESNPGRSLVILFSDE
jgi:hypothetical protein